MALYKGLPGTIPSQRGFTIVVHDGYCYHVEKLRGNEARYALKCTHYQVQTTNKKKVKCMVRASCDLNFKDVQIHSKDLEHCHPKSLSYEESVKTIEELKAAALKQDRTRTLNDVYREFMDK